MLNQLMCSHRSPNLEGHGSQTPRPANPTSQPKISESDQMIRMVMGQKNASDFAEWQAELIQPLHRTASCIEDEFLRPDFDQRAGSETIDSRRRRATAQKSDAKQIVRWLQHSRIPVSSADPLSNTL